MAHEEEPILFLWSFSPWASKVVAYLALRGIPHARCEQPITQPRPDLAALGVKYRRIPVLSIGRDIHCDSLLILEKLELLYQDAEYKPLGATGGTELALEKLFEKWTDVVVFKPAAAAIPTDLDLMKDAAFQKDREELWGRPWTKDEQKKLRPAALANLRADFDFLESVLSDGRAWILGGGSDDGPKLADIHACWIFDWLFQLPGAFPEEFFNEKRHPKTMAWRDRYSTAIAKAKESAAKPSELEGPDAVSKILASGMREDHLTFEDDPCGLQQGQEVEMYPIDTGSNFKDSGKLVGMSASEAVISTTTQQDGKEVRIHYPRWNFTIEPLKKAAGQVNGH
ncbi:hypothetical protein LTR85_007158 [Meristemomyces frigidus]|nr:hypothetical protein LTR85_007158 [Meristemomyces frigidus]